MNANELRLGNLLDYYGQTVLVLEIKKNQIIECGYFNDSIGFERKLTEKHSLKPIPLTEKWLLDFGFKRIDHHRFEIQPSQFDWYYTYSIHDNAFRFYVEKLILCLNSIFYVHELQNLYFALTGNKLVLSDAVS